MNFIHFHISCTQNCDHHILLIMTGNAHKESCHKLLLILVREKELYITETDCSGEMVIAFTVNEKNYLLISLFCDVVLWKISSSRSPKLWNISSSRSPKLWGSSFHSTSDSKNECI